MFSELPEEVKPISRKNIKEKFLETLPVEFNRQASLEVARNLAINNTTSDRYIQRFIEEGFVHRCQRDAYKKIKQEENA